MPARNDSGFSPYGDHVRPLTPDHPISPRSPLRNCLAAGPEVSAGMMTNTVGKATPSGPAGPSKLFTIYSNPLPGPNSTSGCKAAQSSTPEAEFQTSRHAPAPTLLAEPMRAPIGPLCEYRLQ